MASCILISHGTLADAMIKSVEMIVGKKNKLYALGLKVGESPDSFKCKLESVLLLSLESGEVVVISDFLLGTPFNAAVQLSEQYQFQHITGMSVPLLLEILKGCDEQISAQEIVNRALGEALNQTIDVNRFMREMMT